MSWIAVAIGGSAALGAGASIYGSNAAADAQKKAGGKALGEQQRQYNIGMNMLEPQRALGYGALSDIASMYGYALPQYAPANQLLASGSSSRVNGNATMQGGGMQFTGPITVNGRRGRTDYLNPAGVFGIGGSDNRAFGGTIDPLAGTVGLNNAKNPNKAAKREAAATAYLRGESDKLGGSKLRRIRNTIDDMRRAGYEYDPNALADAAAAPQTAGPTGQAGNMDRFFASPDYNFRRAEGIRGIEQGAAARGGALSGNALRAVSGYSSDLASGEFGNYMNRLFNIAGMGQTATGAALNSGQNYANNASGIQQGIGDARASGIVSGITGATNALNSGMNNWMLYRGGYFNRPAGG